MFKFNQALSLWIIYLNVFFSLLQQIHQFACSQLFSCRVLFFHSVFLHPGPGCLTLNLGNPGLSNSNLSGVNNDFSYSVDFVNLNSR